QLALSLQYPAEAVITESEIRMVDWKHALPDFERPGQHGLRFLEPVHLLQGQSDIVETIGQERTVLPIPLLNDRLRFPEGLQCGGKIALMDLQHPQTPEARIDFAAVGRRTLLDSQCTTMRGNGFIEAPKLRTHGTQVVQDACDIQVIFTQDAHAN